MASPPTPRERLLEHRAGVLEADGAPHPVQFIIDGRDGTLVLRGGREMFQADEVVLWLPDDGFESLQVLVRLDELDPPEGFLEDRHLAYHGESTATRWARATPTEARDPDGVYDGGDMLAPNRLRAIEPKLCKLLNSDHDKLRLLVTRTLHTPIADPLIVGVDELGFDIRAGVGIVRAKWQQELDPDTAIDEIAARLDQP
ncbi:MAG: hypothetical protein AAGI17_09850 [Planctomycetota bacterium]